MIENMKINQQQLEIGLDANAKSSCARPAQQRRKRAQWWFHQMRVLVDSAVEWTPAPPARPEQTYFTLSHSE